MHHPTIAQPLVDVLVREVLDHLTPVGPSEDAPPVPPLTLQTLEEQVLRTVKTFGARLLTALTQHFVPTDPPTTSPCPCGATAHLQRLRPATCATVLGPLTITRPYYLCPTCHHGHAPFDQQLGWCAGRRSAGLDELLALLGATQDSFAEAASVLTRLTLVDVAPNTVRAATEELGVVLTAHETAQVHVLQTGAHLDGTTPASSGPLCISLDGVQAHLRPEGWKEVCVGAVYEVRPARHLRQRRADAVQAQALSYVAELGSQREAFGWQLYAEAQRRGAASREVVVVGDGAAWLWLLADLHFPQATQILDWFHATESVWHAASAIWGTQDAARTAWAEQQLTALWAGQVATVLTVLQQHQHCGELVSSAHTYFTNQQQRMDYPTYRARGLPIGSGTIESGCKQLVTSRLKGAGMIWSGAGARHVVKVRAWLRSGRWQAAMALRPAPQRRCRVRPGETAAAGAAAVPVAPADAQLVAEAIAQVRAERMKDQAQHPWRRAWSRRQQRAAGGESVRQSARVSSA